MTGPERVVCGIGAWIVLAAVVNGTEKDWLAAGICLLGAAGCFSWVFGSAADRRIRGQERERARLADALEWEKRVREEQEFEREAWRAEEALRHSTGEVNVEEGEDVRAEHEVRRGREGRRSDQCRD